MKDGNTTTEEESSKIKNFIVKPRNKPINAIQHHQPILAAAVATTTTTTTTGSGGDLLQGTFNEEESHNSFLEALM